MDTATSNPSPFALHARVILHGLVKAPELNGKSGIVTSSAIKDGRQTVHIPDLSRSVSLRLDNMKYEGRSADKLSIKEMKAVLQKKNIPEIELGGMDKTELRAKVEESASPEEIAEILYTIESTPTRTSKEKKSKEASEDTMPTQAAQRLDSMTPEQLRYQAQMLRSSDPNMIRRMNPQMANFSDDQIKKAADQMEMMALNPDMMKMAVEQMKNMGPEDLRNAQNQMAAGTDPNQAADALSNMTPEQLRQQAQMMRSMDPDMVRSMNPQMQNMTDDQIKLAADQMEMMANNPEMMKMTADKLKNMPPDYLEKIKKGQIDGNLNSMDFAKIDPSKMAETMDPAMMKHSIQLLKSDPSMVKKFAAQTGLSEEQVNKTVEMFGNLSDDQLDKAISWMVRVQKAKGVASNVWNKANGMFGGHLSKILCLLFAYMLCLIVQRLFFRGGNVGDTIKDTYIAEEMPVPVLNQDEFENEF